MRRASLLDAVSERNVNVTGCQSLTERMYVCLGCAAVHPSFRVVALAETATEGARGRGGGSNNSLYSPVERFPHPIPVILLSSTPV